MRNIDQLMTAIQEYIFAPIGYLLYSVAVLVFFFGLLEFMWALYNDASEKREDGKRHMLWGVIGFVIMFSVKGIVAMIANFLGADTSFDLY